MLNMQNESIFIYRKDKSIYLIFKLILFIIFLIGLNKIFCFKNNFFQLPATNSKINAFNFNYNNILTGWTDFFDGTPENITVSIFETSSHLNISTKDSYVKNCYFYKMSGANYGGAIYIMRSEKDFRALIEDCMFYECSSLKNGGAIYAYLSDMVCNKLCGYQCEISFAFSVFTEVSVDSSTNSLILCTISNCPAAQYECITHHMSGFDLCKQTNMSNNICGYCSGIHTGPDKTNDDYIGSLIIYSSFVNNTATEYSLVSFENRFNHSIQYSNIILNSQPNDASRGLIGDSSDISIYHCCIKENKGSPIFK